MKTKINLKKLLPYLPAQVQESVDQRLNEIEVNDPYVKRMGMIGDLTIYKGEERIVLATISKVRLDRDREVVMSKGMILDEYDKNPIILVNHKWDSIPVGQALYTRSYDDRIRQKIQFDTDEQSMVIFNKFQSGSLRSFSVGFIPMVIAINGSAEFNQYADKVIQAGWMDMKDVDQTKLFITKSLLIENSVVTIPSNVDALAEAVSDTEEVEPTEVIETQTEPITILDLEPMKNSAETEDAETKDIFVTQWDDTENGKVTEIVVTDEPVEDTEDTKDETKDAETKEPAVPVKAEIKTIIRTIKKAVVTPPRKITKLDIKGIVKDELWLRKGGI